MCDTITNVIVIPHERTIMSQEELNRALQDFEADFRYLEAILLQARKR